MVIQSTIVGQGRHVQSAVSSLFDATSILAFLIQRPLVCRPIQNGCLYTDYNGARGAGFTTIIHWNCQDYAYIIVYMFED